MGSFSWLFADTNNTKNLRADRRGYPSKWDPEQGLCEYRPRYV